ncbi:hypothetical protein, conserved [Plasmodium gonderi]|uniref:Uncharacterized protein n=1 Tax=Plasmodium gonderi TaxID=77519 RepID=A0A1Y1JFQ6_PLAGO|nr:hypothetical protein, conserved [Plasmodium gonderi]GAW80488.1 hypothetical protein, conserved [Plasmodium gonderi]
MAAFKPYKFIIFDKNLRNNNLHKQIIAHLDLSILCEEIYVTEKFCHLNYEHLSRNKLVYFSDHNLVDKLKCRQYGYKVEEKHPKFSPSEHDLNVEDKFEIKVRKNDIMKEKQEEISNNEMCRNKEGNINSLVSFFTFDDKEKNNFFNTLNLNKKYEVDHINILCLNNYNFILDILKKETFKNRISIFCPFYIIHNHAHNDKNKSQNKNVTQKLSNFLYTIVSDFLPINYKYIHMSDLVRAIIINTELCQGKERNDVEVLKFMDMMQIIGKAL